MDISAQLVKELRERTGAPMMQCKQALVETKGDLEAAIESLRKKGVAQAAKKAGRVAAEGVVTSYIHAGGKIGVLLELNCETDFVARTEDFQALAHDIAMHIAASDPRFVRREDVGQDVIAKEREIYAEQAAASGKPPAVIEKMVSGRIEKFFGESVLLEQPFVKNPDQTVGQLVTERVAKIGENIQVRRFVRFRLGEGIQREEKDFAAEVAAAVG